MSSLSPYLYFPFTSPILQDITALRLLLRLLHTVLCLLLLLHSSIQQLFGIFLTHLRLLLLWLVLLILILFLVLFLLIFLIVFILIVLVLLLVLFVLILFLLLVLTENEIIARLIISRIQAEGILIGLYRLAVHLV